jgi:hypothetical protein
MQRFRTLGLLPESLELLDRLLSAQVRFLVIGGAAVRAHIGRRRKPNDLDILLDPSLDNATKFYGLLPVLGYKAAYAVEDLTKPKKRVVLKSQQACYNSEALTPAADVDFGLLWQRALRITVAGKQLCVIGTNDLMIMKTNTGRIRDARDLKLLSKYAV